MSYHIYTTDGIILKRKNFGEGNVLLYVLTKDLGLIIASAQAVRTHKSKLSSSLVEYSSVLISCVKGKNGWKITNAVAKENFFFDMESVSQNLLAKISTVLIKMMPGEERNLEVFDLTEKSFMFLKNVSIKDLSNFECLIMLKLLYYLGYVARNEKLNYFLEEGRELNEDLFQKVDEQKIEIVNIINKGLKESHL